ncbi:FG-GAP-like repeat-containing protein [Actinokineospora sp. PR83]|uniref:FG-GAP repeat domain-containing protein n=1 Tax=Actinokineospora sp. PR83 TaxID=2884908 RepID=UPI0027E00054|nr:VCBS repeat-containing protein [Actinokineospora sp. PR83]MCG8920423.1 FG-GAP-like repeat-containing protein [Actinokineospora sp. PR83]
MLRSVFVGSVVAGLLAVSVWPAAAAGPNKPFLGDLNEDGRADRVTLGSVGLTSTCTVSVQDGLVGGGFAAAVQHSYVSPRTSGPLPYCPDMGEVVDLGGDGTPEIVTTGFYWYGATDALLVLRDFAPVASFSGLSMPSTLRAVDFDGDGRKDLWSSTDQSSRLRTYTNTAAGTLVPGPFEVCSDASLPQHAFADFDGDGGQDMLLYRRCGLGVGRAAELYPGGGGPPVVFATSTTATYEVFVGDFDYNGVPDVGLITKASGGAVTVRHFLNDGAAGFTELP